jgi:transcriptional regulator with XRE-family HTH domain
MHIFWGGDLVFYEKFINLCEKHGVSPSRALTELGISKGSLSRWKEGGKPLNENKKLIADYFGITVAELLEEPKKRAAAEYGDGLSDKEAEWLKLYHLIPENRRAEYLAMLEAALKTQGLI